MVVRIRVGAVGVEGRGSHSRHISKVESDLIPGVLTGWVGVYEKMEDEDSCFGREEGEEQSLH